MNDDETGCVLDTVERLRWAERTADDALRRVTLLLSRLSKIDAHTAEGEERAA